MASQVVYQLIADPDRFKGGMGEAEKAAGGFSDKFKSMAGTIVKGGLVIGGAVAAASAVFFDHGRELESIERKSKIVFGDQLPVIKTWAEANAHAMGMTSSEAINAASSLQDLLIPMGFSREAATKMTTDVVGLSGALAEWSNGQYNASEVSQILAKAMLGEREQLKSLGISISENDVTARLALKGQQNLTGEALQQAKALATQELIMEKSTDAQRAFADGADSAARKAASMGATIREGFDAVTGAVFPATQALGPFLMGVGSLGGALGPMKTALLAAIPAVLSMGGAFQIMLGPIGLVTLAIGAVAAAFAFDLFGMRTAVGGAVDDMAMNFGEMGDTIHDIADRTGEDFQDIKDRTKHYMGEMGLSFEDAATAAEAELTQIPATISSVMADGVGEFKRGSREIAAENRRGAQAAIRPYKDLRGKYREEAFQSMVAYARGLRDGRDNVKVQYALMLEDQKNQQTKTERIGYLTGLLTGKELRNGLNSADPLVRAQAEATRRGIVNQLNAEGVFKYNGYLAGVAFGDGIANGTYAARWTVQQAVAGLAGVIRAEWPGSEPKNPSSPLRGITKAFGFGDVLAGGISASKAKIAGAMRSAMGVPSLDGGPTHIPAFAGGGSAFGGGRPVQINFNGPVYGDDMEELAKRLAMRLRTVG